MNRKTLSIPTLTLLLALAAGAAAPAAAQGEWQLKLSGVYAESTSGGGSEGSLGAGLAIEYRASPRLGIEVGGLTADLDSESPIDFFGIGNLTVESEVPIRPVLARLNFHLTPDRRAEVYLGPVAGYVFVDDLTLRITVDFPPFPRTSETIDFRTEDQFTWGAHAGVDVRLGAPGSRSFLTAGVTWLDLPIEVRLPPPDPAAGDNTIDFDPVRGDLDPLVVSVGYSYRF